MTDTTIETPSGDPEAPERQERAALEAPGNWPAKDRAMFEQQSPEAQAYLLDRDRALNAAFTRKLQDAAPYRALADEFRDYIDHVGKTPDEVFRLLIETDRVLRYSALDAKFPAVWNILTEYGIDPVQFAEAVMAVTVRERATVEAQAVQASQEQAAAADRQRRSMEATMAISRMAADPVTYPHLHALQGAINEAVAAALDRGETPDLHRLYTEASWSVPAVRDAMIADERKQAARDGVAAADAERKAERARQERLAVSIRPSGGSEPMPPSGMSVEELLAEQMGIPVPRA